MHFIKNLSMNNYKSIHDSLLLLSHCLQCTVNSNVAILVTELAMDSIQAFLLTAVILVIDNNYCAQG